jgi:hypothetical protein
MNTEIKTLTLRDGYDRTKHPAVHTFRPMTPDEARALGWGTGEIYFECDGGTFKRCRPNGRPKTWKTRPADVELPVKYGLRECARAVSRNGEMVLPSGGRLLVLIGG